MRAAALFLVAALGLGPSPVAAQSTDPTRLPGQFRAPQALDAGVMSIPRGMTVTKESSRAIFDNMRAVIELFHRAPIFANPVGFVAKPLYESSFGQRGWGDQRYRRWPLPGRIDLQLVEHYIDQGDGKLHADGSGESISILIQVNDIDCVFQATDIPVLTDSSWFFEPRAVGEEHGNPVYPKGCIVVSARAAPLFVPVTKERLFRSLIHRRELDFRQIEPMAASKSPETQQFVAKERAALAKMKARLAGMPAAERSEPAYFSLAGGAAEPFGKKGDLNTYLIVERNPDLVDPSKPPGEMQFLSFRFGLCMVAEDCTGERARVWAARKQLDWEALRRLLK